MSVRVKFWGVRGSIACPLASHIGYGGNTSCIEVDSGSYRLLLDAGTGIRSAGKALLQSDVREAHVLLTHTHWDHINGFPFFGPAFNANGRFHMMAGHLGEGHHLESVLSVQMANPMFPVPLDAMKADISFEDFNAGDRFALPDGLVVKTAPLNHPDGATGYRIEHQGSVMCYVTDTEHLPGEMDANILSLIEGADLVIYDSTYTDAEFDDHVGWGHSTWQQGARLCRRAGVKKMAIFHHDPDHDDEFMAALETEARRSWSGLFVARDNLELTLP